MTDQRSDREATQELPVGKDVNRAVLSESCETLVLMVAPFVPHMGDELYNRLGYTGSTWHAQWPAVDEKAAVQDEVTIVVQVNNKVRDRITVPADLPEEQLKTRALESEKVREKMDGLKVRNVIVVPGKLVNIVMG